MIRQHLIGAAHLDRIGRTASAAVLKQSNPGQSDEVPGGAALNVASSLRALGADTMLSSILGEDSAGIWIADALASRGIKIAMQRPMNGAATASYSAIIDPEGDLVIALADMAIYDMLQADAVKIEPDDWITCDANLSSRTIEAIVAIPSAFRAGLTVSAAKAVRLRSVLRRLDLLFTNRAEAAAICDLPSEMTIVDLAGGLASLGTRNAVISDGASSVCVLERGGIKFVAVPQTQVVDVTGAGDALVSGSLFALSRGSSLVDAVGHGIKVARAILGVSGSYRADLAQAIGAN